MANADLVWVGTPYTPEATNSVLDWIEAYFGKQDIVEINTGYHVDNLGGNPALLERGIAVYGADLTAQLLDERGEQTRAAILGMLEGAGNQAIVQAHAAIQYMPPSILYPIQDGLVLKFGDETVQVYFPGPSHAPDNVVVYFPGQKVLFGGCMILAGDQVGNTSDADLKAWPESVGRLSQFQADWIIPGHGDRFDPGLLEHTISVLTKSP